jgi:hypothetical protein
MVLARFHRRDAHERRRRRWFRRGVGSERVGAERKTIALEAGRRRSRPTRVFKLAALMQATFSTCDSSRK